MDNWFSSVEVASELINKKITYLGTIKKNKHELPPDFTVTKGRNVQSALYGFSGQTTIVSFVPKKGNVVNLISTMHHKEETDDETGKPIIIMDYNQTKEGVDALDEKCTNYTTGRRTAVSYTHLDVYKRQCCN